MINILTELLNILAEYLSIYKYCSLLGVLLWGKWGLFEPWGIQALKSSAVWCNGVARGVS